MIYDIQIQIYVSGLKEMHYQKQQVLSGEGRMERMCGIHVAVRRDKDCSAQVEECGAGEATVREMKIGGAWPKTLVGRSEKGNNGYIEFQEGQA